MYNLATASTANYNLSSAVSIGSYTASGIHNVFFRAFLGTGANTCVGGGNYSIYLTVQRGGSGNTHTAQPTTTATVASGVLSIMFSTDSVPVASGDVVNVMALGLAGDTSVGCLVETWDDASAQAAPAAAGGMLTYGTSTGQINPTSGGVDIQTIKTQAVTCSAGVTVGAYVGNATHALVVDSSGSVTFNNTTIGTVATVTNAVTFPSSASINITGNITGNLSGSVGSVTGNVGGNVTGSVGSIAANGITTTSFAAACEPSTTFFTNSGGGGLTVQQVRDALDLQATAGGVSIDTQLAEIASLSGGSGSGSVPYVFLVTLGTGNPAYNVAVSVYVDQACTEQIPGTGTLFTNQSGTVTFYLNSGTYWFKAELTNATFTPNPVQVVIP